MTTARRLAQQATRAALRVVAQLDTRTPGAAEQKPAAGRTAPPRGQPMVRLPAGFHYQAVRNGRKLANMPGLGGSGMQRMQPIPIGAYRGKYLGVPLSGGQVQAQVPAGGALTLSVGPQGIGTVWYPAQATISTTTGPLDTSTCKIYLGTQGVPVALVATVFPGGAGTAALAVPPMTPGQVLIFQWTGAHVGDIAAANIVGTQDALTTSGLY
jgi:hypothetical protein